MSEVCHYTGEEGWLAAMFTFALLALVYNLLCWWAPALWGRWHRASWNTYGHFYRAWQRLILQRPCSDYHSKLWDSARTRAFTEREGEREKKSEWEKEREEGGLHHGEVHGISLGVKVGVEELVSVHHGSFQSAHCVSKKLPLGWSYFNVLDH